MPSAGAVEPDDQRADQRPQHEVVLEAGPSVQLATRSVGATQMPATLLGGVRVHVVVARLGVVPGRLRAPRRRARSVRRGPPRPGRSAARSGPSSCATSSTVPPRRRNRRSAPANASWLAASTPAVGSSRTSRSGSPARARAISVRCCWPPDRVAHRVADRGRPGRRRPAPRGPRPGRPRPGGRQHAAPGQPAGGDHLADGRRHAAAGADPLRHVADPGPLPEPALRHAEQLDLAGRLSGTSPSTARISVDLPEPLAPRIGDHLAGRHGPARRRAGPPGRRSATAA